MICIRNFNDLPVFVYVNLICKFLIKYFILCSINYKSIKFVDIMNGVFNWCQKYMFDWNFEFSMNFSSNDCSYALTNKNNLIILANDSLNRFVALFYYSLQFINIQIRSRSLIPIFQYQ